MLTQIRCDKFGEGFRTISFHKGLNTVLGSSNGSNALGKSTFLWILDYVFGGDYYCAAGSDVKQHVKDHTVFFTFNFDGENHYFSRNTATPKTVYRCDKTGHLVERMTLEKFRSFLNVQYHPGIALNEIKDHFFRIYGGKNTYEKLPLHAKPQEPDEKAVEFLLRLFGERKVIDSIHAMEEELGIKAIQWKTEQKPLKSFEKIEENERTIRALKERQHTIMEKNGNSGMEYLGFDTSTYEQLSKMENELRKLTRRQNQLKSKIETIKSGNRDYLAETLESDLSELKDFFPNVNIKVLKDIEAFHIRIREILKEETNEELASLEPMYNRCESEIQRLKEKIEKTGIASDIYQRLLSQCVSIAKRIDDLEKENRDLTHEKELQEARVLAERKMDKLLDELKSVIETIVTKINAKLKTLNDVVTEGKENAPVLNIPSLKEIIFGTVGNTSQGTACKNLVLYDLAILNLTKVPALIHDGNMLRSISSDNFKKILELYNDMEKQIFIAVDKTEDDILKNTAVLELSEGHELYGFSWSRKD